MTATVIGMLGSFFGLIMGYFIGPLYIHKNAFADREAGKDLVTKYLYDAAIMITFMSFPLIILYQDRPKQFPSPAARF